MQQPLNILFMGRSGCGKGTQSALLKSYLEKKYGHDSVLYIYTGEKLRELTKRRDVLTARLVEDKVMLIGDKAPDFLAIWAWGSKFVEEMDDKRHLILDGSPRTDMEAVLIDEALTEFYERKNIFPIFLDVTHEEVMERMKSRGRADDTDEQIKNRLAFYEKYVVPAIEYFKHESKNKLIKIDGNSHDKELIHKNILKALNLEN